MLIGYFSRSNQFPTIIPGRIRNKRSTARLLLRTKRHRITFIGRPATSPTSINHLRKCHRTLTTRKLTCSPTVIISTATSRRNNCKTTSTILGANTATIFYRGSHATVNLCSTLHRQNLHIPSSLSVIKFSGRRIVSTRLRPTLAAIKLPRCSLNMLNMHSLLALGGAPSTSCSDDRASHVRSDGARHFRPLLINYPSIVHSSVHTCHK